MCNYPVQLVVHFTVIGLRSNYRPGYEVNRLCVSSQDLLHRRVWGRDQHISAQGKYSMNALWFTVSQ